MNASASTQAVRLTKSYFTSLRTGFKPERQSLLKTSLMTRAGAPILLRSAANASIMRRGAAPVCAPAPIVGDPSAEISPAISQSFAKEFEERAATKGVEAGRPGFTLLQDG